MVGVVDGNPLKLSTLLTGFELANVLSDSKHYGPFSCGLCKKLGSLDCVVASRCNHIFCRRCLEEFVLTQTLFQKHQQTHFGATPQIIQKPCSFCTCPVCDTSLEPDSVVAGTALASINVACKQLQDIQPLAFQVLQSVQVKCVHTDCNWVGDYGEVLLHLATHIFNRQTSKSNFTENNSVDDDDPPTRFQCLEIKHGDADRSSTVKHIAALEDRSMFTLENDNLDNDQLFPSELRSSAFEGNKSQNRDENSLMPENAEFPIVENVPNVIAFARNEKFSKEGLLISPREAVRVLHSTSISHDNTIMIEKLQVGATSPVKIICQNLDGPGGDTTDTQMEENATFETLPVQTETYSSQLSSHEGNKLVASHKVLSSSGNHQSLLLESPPNSKQNGWPEEKNSKSDTVETETVTDVEELQDLTVSSSVLIDQTSVFRSDENTYGALENDRNREESISYDLVGSERRSPTKNRSKPNWNTSINSIGGCDASDVTEYDQLVDDSEIDDVLNEEERYQRIVKRADKLKKQANAKFNKGKFEESRVLYSESIDLMSSISPGTPNELKLLCSMHSNRAVTFFREKDYQKCIDDCETALRYQPTCDKSWIRKWRALMALGTFKDACNCLEDGLSKIPMSKKILIELRKVRVEKKIIDEVEELLDLNELSKAQGLMKQPLLTTENITMFCLAASIDIRLGETANALEKLEKVLRVNPLQEDALELRGFAYFVSGDLDTGINLLSEAEKVVIGGISLKERLNLSRRTHNKIEEGRIAIARQDYHRAVEHFTEAINANDTLPPRSELFGILRKERAEAYIMSRNFVQALKDCQEVINFRPNYSPVWLLRSEVLIFLGKAEDAKKELFRAKISWGADDPDIEDGYYRADFETRIIREHRDINKLMKQIETGTFDLDRNPTMDKRKSTAGHDTPKSNGKPRGFSESPKPSEKRFNRRSLSHAERRDSEAANFTIQGNDEERNKDPRRKKPAVSQDQSRGKEELVRRRSSQAGYERDKEISKGRVKQKNSRDPSR